LKSATDILAFMILSSMVITGCGHEPGHGSDLKKGRSEAPGTTLSEPAVTTVSSNRLLAAAGEHQNWLTHGRSYDEQRFSPLDQINTSNVKELGLAWHFDIPTKRGIEATPIVVDGRMYVTGAWSMVYALDAADGSELWRYDPEVAREWARYACCDVVNRGVAVWGESVFVGTLDGSSDGSYAWHYQTTPGDS
jgi:glucose dehydrogenase